MVVEAFAKFDNLQQGYEKQNPVDVQPLENPPIVLDIPIDQMKHEDNGVYDHKSLSPII
jgi:hypothetical protein